MSYQVLSTLPANPAGERGSAAKLAYHAQTNQLLYPRGRSLILRSLAPVADAATGPIKFAQPGTSTYVEHVQPITAVQVSPTGFYAATGDAQGTVRVWDLIAGDKVLKLEQKALSGPVKDIAWDAESKRLIAVGDGREKFGTAFLLDSGSSVGTIEGHSKPINAVAVNRARPYRALTVSDDSQAGWYTGVPFKLAQTSRPLTKFIHAAAFSPSGTYAAAAGSDGLVVILDGKEGKALGQVGAGSAQGTIYALSFVPGKDDLLASAGADGKVTIYQLAHASDKVEGSVLTSIDLESGSAQGGDQLVALTFTSPTSLVVQSVRGVLSEVRFPQGFSAPAQVQPLLGPTKGVTDLAVQGSLEGQDLHLSAASYDGRVYTWDLSHGLDFRTGGAPPCTAVAFDKAASGTSSAAVVGLNALSDKTLVGSTLEDKLFYFHASSGSAIQSESKSNALSLPGELKTEALHGQPRTHSVAKDTRGGVYAVTTSGVDVFPSEIAGEGKPYHIKQEGATAVAAYALTSGNVLLAVGLESSKVEVYLLSSGARPDAATPLGQLTSNRTAITVASFSPDGNLLAVGESSGKIVVYDTSSLASSAGSATSSALSSVGPKIVHWVFHTARVESISWSPDSKFAVSGSLDTHVYVWSVAKPMKHLALKDAHAGGVSATLFLGPTHIASAGADGVTKIYGLDALPGQ